MIFGPVVQEEMQFKEKVYRRQMDGGQRHNHKTRGPDGPEALT